MGSSVAGTMRKLLSKTLEHAMTRSQFSKKLIEFEIIQEKLAKIAVKCYAMESMAYMTAGIMDSYTEPDASVEAAMVKIYSSEAAWECISESLQVLGGLGYMKDYPFERYLRDSRILLIFEGTNEILRLYIALTGLQHAGAELKDIIKKLRNPLNNMGFIMKTGFQRMKKTPNIGLTKEVHPTLGNCAQTLEEKLHDYKQQVENALAFYRDSIINEQLVLQRLANISIDLFAMTAVISRASRSISIGLKNSDHEFLLARTFVYEAGKRIDDNIKDLKNGKLANGDENYLQIAQGMVKNNGYFAEHPLTKNW